ncbi:TITIN protein, partial [Locustella ochotensis]|nr:TITIN protein [Locustella ochotensis]
PVANATIIPGPLSHQVHAGDPVTLRCSVQMGSAPVNFTWLRDGQEVAQGPILELRDVDVEHSGIYQCVATNQLGQDEHHVFQALSPKLALEVTPQRHWNKGGVTQGHWDCRTPRVTTDPDMSLLSPVMAIGFGMSLLILLLLVGVAVGWHQWRNKGGVPPDPPASPEEGEVLYTHVVSTKQMRASPCATTLQGPQVTYAELRGPQKQQRELGDIYENVP